MRTLVAMAAYSFNRLIMGKVEIGNFYCLIGDNRILLLKPVSHQPCGSPAPVYEHTFGVFLAAASRPSYVSQGRKAVATSYGEFSTCSFTLRFSADVWRSQGSCKAASR